MLGVQPSQGAEPFGQPTRKRVRLPDCNPRRDHWADHFGVEGARIVPRTPIGRATVAVLWFNSTENLAVRAALMEIGRSPAR